MFNKLWNSKIINHSSECKEFQNHLYNIIASHLLVRSNKCNYSMGSETTEKKMPTTTTKCH